MAAPGWYRDPGSDRLARWFDGQEWTLHTVVMADWRGRGSPPPPEDRTIVQSSGDAYVPPVDGTWAAPAGYEDFAPEQGFEQWDDEPDDYVVAGRGGGYHAPTLADRYREGPPWFRYGAPALLLLIVLVAVAAIAGGGDGDGDGGSVDLGTDGERSLDEVIDIAYDAGFPEEVSEARVGSLIKLACEQVGEDDGVETVAEQIDRFNFDGQELTGATRGLRAGAEAFCEEKVEAEDPNFFRDVAAAVAADTTRSSTTTSTTTADDDTEPSTSTTTKSTSTTKKPTTSTTKKPTPTSTSTSTPATTSTTTPPSSTTTTTEAPTDGGTGGPP